MCFHIPLHDPCGNFWLIFIYSSMWYIRHQSNSDCFKMETYNLPLGFRIKTRILFMAYRVCQGNFSVSSLYHFSSFSPFSKYLALFPEVSKYFIRAFALYYFFSFLGWHLSYLFCLASSFSFFSRQSSLPHLSVSSYLMSYYIVLSL